MTPGVLAVRRGARTAVAAARDSRTALDRPLVADAELSVAPLTTRATILGAFERTCDAPASAAGARPLQRGTGGPFVTVGPGTLHVLLALAHPSSLVPCDARRIVNRHVRPLLRALTRRGALAHYFGRDWVSVTHRPAGQVSFGHDSTTRRTVFEAFVALACPFAPAGRASFLGKEPGTVEALTGVHLDDAAVAGLVGDIASAYASAGDRELVPADELGEPSDDAEAPPQPTWTASVEEAIGLVSAGRDAGGVLRVGGALMGSRDAFARVEAAVAALPPGSGQDEVGAVVDRELGAGGVALEGVRDLRSLRDVLFRAR